MEPNAKINISPLADNRRYRWVLVCLGIALLAGLALHYGVAEIFASYARLDVFWTGVSALCLALTSVIGAINVYLLLRHVHLPPFLRFLSIYWVAWGIGLVMPGQIGGIAAISWALRKYNMAVSFTLSRSMLDKLISLMVMGGVGTIGAISLIGRPDVGYVTFALLAVVLTLTGAVTLPSTRRLTGRVFDPAKAGWIGGAGRTIEEVSSALLTMPGKLAANAMLSIVKVGLVGCTYWAMFSALGYGHLAIWQVTAVAVLSGLVAYLPISFNGLGTVEATAIVLFGQLGIPASKVLAGYLCLRVMVLALAWLPSLILVAVTRQEISIRTNE